MFQNHWFQISIPLVSSFNSIGFQSQFQWFRVLKPMVFSFKTNGFEKWFRRFRFLIGSEWMFSVGGRCFRVLQDFMILLALRQ